MNIKNNSDEWLIAIAEKAGINVDRVNEVLASKRICPAPVIPMPRRLTLLRIAFSGTKTGIDKEGNFSFEWNDLDCGMWAIITEKNFKGKSSIIEIVRWMLRGRPSDNLQEDVKKWISDCNLLFKLDDAVFEIRVHQEKGLTGELLRLTSGVQERVYASFSGESEFEAVMSDFFLKELSLDMIARGKADGKSVLHGWPALSGVLFIGTDYSTLLGDVPPAAGITVPLMQMYLGLPWISTLTSAKASFQELQREQELKSRNNENAKKAKKIRIDAIHAELEVKTEALSKTPSDKEVRDSLEKLNSQFVKFKVFERELLGSLERVKQIIAEAEIIYANDRREFQSLIDEEAAGAIFRKLDPTLCPRCDHRISEEKKNLEKTSHKCSICGEYIISDENFDDIKSQLKTRVDASKAALGAARQEYNNAEEELKNTQQQIENIDVQIQLLTKKAATFDARRLLEFDIAKLEAKLEEIGLDIDQNDAFSDDIKIIKAIIDETEQRAKALQNELLKAVSDEMLKFGQKFGINNLNAIDLKGNGSLFLVKAGQRTSYSKVTAGEKLRLKVAAVLAMIRVSETRGVGRHPGLLMVDSPGAHEVTIDDLSEFIICLQDATRDFQHLQIFVASISSPVITANIQMNRTRYACGDESLW
jgi:hypothetical protein